MRWLLGGILLVHSVIHVMGFAKAFGYAELPQLSNLTRGAGLAWLAAALFMAVAAAMVLRWPAVWWVAGVFAVIVSQAVIFMAWRDGWAGTILNVVILVAAGLSAAEWRWELMTRAAVRRLDSLKASPVAVYSEKELGGLPPAVQKYFRKVLTPGQPMIAHARVISRGVFNMGEPPKDNWRPFTAVQDFYPGAPGFVWNARIRMAPALNVFVRDEFVGGEGAMLGSILGLKTVVSSRGTPQVAEASLMRYLAEAPWFPTALLPSQGVQWSPLPDGAARAALTVGTVTASLDFRFGEDGLILKCEAIRENDKLHAKFPWGGKSFNWIEKDGMKLPTEADVFWRLPTGDFAYWRGRVEPIYEFAK